MNNFIIYFLLMFISWRGSGKGKSEEKVTEMLPTAAKMCGFLNHFPKVDEWTWNLLKLPRKTGTSGWWYQTQRELHPKKDYPLLVEWMKSREPSLMKISFITFLLFITKSFHNGNSFWHRCSYVFLPSFYTLTFYLPTLDIM
jgi:hypothetical protein